MSEPVSLAIGLVKFLGGALPAWQEWFAAALVEPWVMQGNEVDWPQVRRIEIA